MKKVIGAFLCSAWLVLGGATGESGQAQAQEKKLTDITFSLDFITLGRHAPFYVAIDKGFYKEEGLNVNIVPAKGTAQGIQNVESGIAQIGFVDVASLVVARAEGSTVKVVSVIYQKAPFCFFSLGQIVNWLILVQIVSQFIWQCAGVILLRRYRKDLPQPFRMWLYPIPAIVALVLWLYVFVSAPASGIIFALGFVAAGIVAYFIFSAASARRPQPAGS